MTKFYRVKKDTPMWEKGAILSNENDKEFFVAIQDIWNIHEDTETWGEGSQIVENSPDWYERVYSVNLLSKTVYKIKNEFKEYLKKEQGK